LRATGVRSGRERRTPTPHGTAEPQSPLLELPSRPPVSCLSGCRFLCISLKDGRRTGRTPLLPGSWVPTSQGAASATNMLKVFDPAKSKALYGQE
jgi:hypothetical protein